MASPNHGDRRGQRPELVVLHYTGMPDAASAHARLCDPAAEVSAHWLIDETGALTALVDESRRAWHAGAGSWQGRDDVNSRSIGIEIANPGNRPFTAPQMKALETLLKQILTRWQIPPEAVIAHSDMAPGRKIDPGPRFDWEGLARQGLATFVRPLPADPAPPLGPSLDALGYAPADPAIRLESFRLRHRPWARGPETLQDRQTAARLLPCANTPGDALQGRGAAPPFRS